DHVISSVAKCQEKLPVRLRCWPSARNASLRFSAASARFRSSISVFVPYQFTILPVSSRNGQNRNRYHRYSPSKRRRRPSRRKALNPTKSEPLHGAHTSCSFIARGEVPKRHFARDVGHRRC